MIRGAATAEQVSPNAVAAWSSPPRKEQDDGVRGVYDSVIPRHVQSRW
jgi:hypothetical protein